MQTIDPGYHRKNEKKSTERKWKYERLLILIGPMRTLEAGKNERLKL